MNNKIIQVRNLSKSFEAAQALDSVEFAVDEGELFGFIGPDGAGKTTLFRILTSLLIPDEGEVEVLGLDPVKDYRELRPLLGYMPGRFSLYQDLSVEENLNFFASIFGTTVEEHYELIKPIYSQIEPFRERLAGALSGGMKQKLALSCSLVHRPKLLMLDEPTTGVDAISRKEFWEMLRFLKEEGITIVVSTPYMDEASLCDRVALIQDGRLLSVDTPDRVVDGFDKPLLAVKASDRYRLIQELRGYEWAESVHPFGEFLHYTDKRGQAYPDELRTWLQKRGFEELEVKPVEPQIEDQFMNLMKK